MCSRTDNRTHRNAIYLTHEPKRSAQHRSAAHGHRAQHPHRPRPGRDCDFSVPWHEGADPEPNRRNHPSTRPRRRSPRRSRHRARGRWDGAAADATGRSWGWCRIGDGAWFGLNGMDRKSSRCLVRILCFLVTGLFFVDFDLTSAKGKQENAFMFSIQALGAALYFANRSVGFAPSISASEQHAWPPIKIRFENLTSSQPKRPKQP